MRKDAMWERLMRKFGEHLCLHYNPWIFLRPNFAPPVECQDEIPRLESHVHNQIFLGMHFFMRMYSPYFCAQIIQPFLLNNRTMPHCVSKSSRIEGQATSQATILAHQKSVFAHEEKYIQVSMMDLVLWKLGRWAFLLFVAHILETSPSLQCMHFLVSLDAQCSLVSS